MVPPDESAGATTTPHASPKRWVKLARQQARSRPAHVAAIVTAVVIVVLLVRMAAVVITPSPHTADEREYVGSGVYLAGTGEFGYQGEPWMFIEPVVPAAIAVQILVDPRLSEARHEGAVVSDRAIRAVKQQNVMWALILLVGIAMQTHLLAKRFSPRTRRWIPLFAVVAVYMTFVENPDIADRNLTELAAAAMVVWCGVWASLVVQRPRVRWAALLGVTLGVLALTRASFLYLAAVYLIVLAVLQLARQKNLRQTAIGLAVAIVTLAMTVSPWMLRNQAQFDQFSIAERGGSVMWLRVVKNEMTPLEYRGAWVWWGPNELEPIIARIVGVNLEDFTEGGALERVDRENAESFYRQGTRDRTELAASFESAGMTPGTPYADDELQRRALAQLASNPWSFLRTTPVFMWRNSWPMDSARLVPSVVLGALNLAGVALAYATAIWAVVRRRPELFAIAGLPAGLLAFNVLLTHALFRYARPAAPTMVLLVLLAVAEALRRIRMRDATTQDSRG